MLDLGALIAAGACIGGFIAFVLAQLAKDLNRRPNRTLWIEIGVGLGGAWGVGTYLASVIGWGP